MIKAIKILIIISVLLLSCLMVYLFFSTNWYHNYLIKKNFVDVDVGTFKMLSGDGKMIYNDDYRFYASDNKHIYWDKNEIKDADMNSFEALNYTHAKDKNNYYYEGKIMDGVDRETFVVIDLLRSKDKNHTYYKGEIVK